VLSLPSSPIKQVTACGSDLGSHFCATPFFLQIRRVTQGEPSSFSHPAFLTPPGTDTAPTRILLPCSYFLPVVQLIPFFLIFGNKFHLGSVRRIWASAQCGTRSSLLHVFPSGRSLYAGKTSQEKPTGVEG